MFEYESARVIQSIVHKFTLSLPQQQCICILMVGWHAFCVDNLLINQTRIFAQTSNDFIIARISTFARTQLHNMWSSHFTFIPTILESGNGWMAVRWHISLLNKMRSNCCWPLSLFGQHLRYEWPRVQRTTFCRIICTNRRLTENTAPPLVVISLAFSSIVLCSSLIDHKIY